MGSLLLFHSLLRHATRSCDVAVVVVLVVFGAAVAFVEVGAGESAFAGGLVGGGGEGGESGEHVRRFGGEVSRSASAVCSLPSGGIARALSCLSTFAPGFRFASTAPGVRKGSKSKSPFAVSVSWQPMP